MENSPATLDADTAARRRLSNLLQSLMLIAGMALLLAGCGWIIAGPEGVVISALAGATTFAVSGRISPDLMLRLYRARPITAREAPELIDIMAALAERAGLTRQPRLFYVSSPVLNAFSVGRGNQAAIAVTTGVLHAMTLRQVTAILAHEISHIRHKDIWVMGLADVLTRMTRTMSLLGILLLIVNLPFAAAGVGTVPWALVLLLVFAPTLGSLLQLALSRTREFEADLGAVRLTGDPLGLAAALEKMERAQGRFWEDIFIGGRRIPDPSLLRSHPHTAERIRRLLALRAEPHPGPLDMRETKVRARRPFPSLPARPRQRISGLWF